MSVRSTITFKTSITIAVATVVLLSAGVAGAQNKKKLYCWKQNGQRTCGDTLPPGAVDLAHSEISEKSGLATGHVDRTLTADERTAATTAAGQAQATADAEAARQRRDLAMVESYASEGDLRHAYGERIALVESALKTSVLGEANLRRSLVSLLDQASENELDGKPVVPALLANIRTQHEQLQTQLRITRQQHSDRASLDGELEDAVRRYQGMKQAQVGPTVEAPTP